MSGKQQDLEGDPRAGDCKENNWIFHQGSKNECQEIMEGSSLSKMKEETAQRVRTGSVGTPGTLGSFFFTDRRNRMMVINLDRLASYEGTTQDKQPKGVNGSSWKVITMKTATGRKVRPSREIFTFFSDPLFGIKI
jgi:hypothetical protein